MSDADVVTSLTAAAGGPEAAAGPLTATKDDAFTLLRIASQTQNRKLAAIAADVVDTGTLDLPELA